MRIAWDLDGVLRELNIYLQKKYNIPYPKKWGWEHEGKNIFDWAKQDNYEICFKAPPTEYVEIYRIFTKGSEIWTCQPELWRKNTLKWIKKYLGNCKVKFLTTEEKREELDKNTDCLLVEDNPNFKNYDRILLIDRPYNRRIKNVVRIKNVSDFANILKTNINTVV